MAMHPAIAELCAGFNDPFGQLGRDAGEDATRVVLSWPAVPVEIVRAAGFQAVLARSDDAPTPRADEHLEPGVFPGRLRQLVEAALAGRLAHAAAIAIPRTSDPDYKCFLYLREFARRGIGGPLPPVLLFDLLQTGGRGVADYDRARMQLLFQELARLSGSRSTPSDLAFQIALANQARAAGRQLQALRNGSSRISGADSMRCLGAFWQVDAARYAGLAARASEAIAARQPLRRPRVLLAGAPVDGAMLHEAIEALGGVVVDELSPYGSHACAGDVLEDGELLAALALSYREHVLSARTPASRILQTFESAITAIDAVVFWVPPEDASFAWDLPRLREALDQQGLPHLVLAGDTGTPLPFRDLQRLRALLDMAIREPVIRHG